MLFTAEENGIWGGKAYAEERFDDLRLIAALESDSGNGRAEGFGLDLKGIADESTHPDIEAQVAEMLNALSGAGVVSIEKGYSGADVGPSVRKGVVGFGLRHDTSTYWPIHHTDADTFEKIVPEDLAHNVGVMAAAVYYLAQQDEPMTPPQRKRKRRR